MDEAHYTQDLAQQASKLMSEGKYELAEALLKKAARVIQQLDTSTDASVVELKLGL